MGCGHDQPGVFPRVAGISLAYGVEWGGMEYKRLGGWASVQLGDEFCMCLRLVFLFGVGKVSV